MIAGRGISSCGHQNRNVCHGLQEPAAGLEDQQLSEAELGPKEAQRLVSFSLYFDLQKMHSFYLVVEVCFCTDLPSIPFCIGSRMLKNDPRPSLAESPLKMEKHK